jgi:hypothetical protein
MTSKQGSFCLTGGADDPELFKLGEAEEDGEENESIAELNTITRKELFRSCMSLLRIRQICQWCQVARPSAKMRDLGGTVPVALKLYGQCHLSVVLEQYSNLRWPLSYSITAVIAS